MAKILLIEDYANLQKIYKEILELEHHTVRTAENATEGLGIAQEEDFDVILLDLLLQQTWGLDFLTDFDKKKHPNTKIIVISNLFTTEILNKALELGASHYLMKSEVTPQQLADIVRETLNETQQASATDEV